MKNYRTMFVICLAVGGGLLSSTQPAFATKAREAIVRCDANPNCNFQVDKAGGVDICIKGPRSTCDTWVSCPKNGDCTVMKVKGTKLPAPKMSGVNAAIHN